MFVDGYAFKKDWKEIQNRQLGIIGDNLPIKGLSWTKNPSYKKTIFNGSLETEEAKKLNEETILLLVSGGLPFGGTCEIKGDSFSGVIWED